MKAFIENSSCISASPTFDADVFFGESIATPLANEGKLNAQDPDYKSIITDAGKRRRMGHLIKMGISSSLSALKGTNYAKPDAIMTATAMGGLEDTEKFLRCIIDNDEQLANPSNFIQSTGNTFGGQTGLLLQHHGHNVTYAHGGFSFESALIDAMMQMADDEIETALVTAADEITATEYEVMRKMGFWRNGRMMGEGSQAFLLTSSPNEKTKTAIIGLKTLKGPLSVSDLSNAIQDLTHKAGYDTEDIDLMLHGVDCDYEAEKTIIGYGKHQINYKKWCGQFATASGFGLWMANELLSRQIIPSAEEWEAAHLKLAMVYTEYRQNDYSLMLVATV